MTVEVYKTNVAEPLYARVLVALIHKTFPDCRANFDLQDRDRILRIASTGPIDSDRLADWLQSFGCHAEPLPDEVPVSWLPYPGDVQLLGPCLTHMN